MLIKKFFLEDDREKPQKIPSLFFTSNYCSESSLFWRKIYSHLDLLLMIYLLLLMVYLSIYLSI